MKKCFHGLLFVVLYSFFSKHTFGSEDSNFPPSPPPPAPDENPSTTARPTAAQDSNAQLLQLSGNQCSLGANLSMQLLGSEVALSGKLYVDFGTIVPCRGIVTRWEVCIGKSGLLDSHSAIDFVVLRLNRIRAGYLVVSVHELIVQNSFGLVGSIQCDYIDNREGSIFMEKGDLLGFVNRINLGVALAVLPEGASSTLRIFDFGLMGDNRQERVENSVPLQINTSIAQERFEESTQRLTPLIRVILNSTPSADEDMLPPVTEDPHTCGCPDGNSPGSDSAPHTSALFISVTSTAGIVILALCVLVICLACCLCQRHGYKLSHSCCQKKQKVTRIIRVEPLLEQSMQYNELYVPGNQNEGGSRREKHMDMSNVQENPAYNTGQVGAFVESERKCAQGGTSMTTFTNVSDIKQSQDGRMQVDTTPGDLEHSYEVVRSMKLS